MLVGDGGVGGVDVDDEVAVRGEAGGRLGQVKLGCHAYVSRATQLLVDEVLFGQPFRHDRVCVCNASVSIVESSAATATRQTVMTYIGTGHVVLNPGKPRHDP